jgi:hypothetical protein
LEILLGGWRPIEARLNNTSSYLSDAELNMSGLLKPSVGNEKKQIFLKPSVVISWSNYSLSDID